MKKLNKKGFTIVELVIVIAVIAILAAVMIPTFSGVVDKANQSKALQQARNNFTELYAEDIADGVVDGLGVNDQTVDANYVVDTAANSTDETVHYEYTGVAGYKAIYNDGEWTVVTVTP